MDIGGWLRRLGLEQYEATFRENEIDDTVLPSLTAEDLKDLGVGLVGHRRKLLDAIAVLRADSTKTVPTAPAAVAAPTSAPAAEAGERVAMVTASARSLPALTYAIDEDMLANMTCTCPASRSGT